ncbi:hypothetical protein NN3_15110 [Nocardia neocaledoniensis NBRC 108232]|uniref:Uncharacterized protein n=2 Tax=Nocardia neocaledoniensis TaxID=236511 RepID=A0A317NI67_9NOCA|nr:hypothetical protein DFR69_10577 [Nocardia neocaledoniensis]GEM30504.1 hypothetical protein NN3_15110 [Nocardia neocaledoniensis NBRC 108232]
MAVPAVVAAPATAAVRDTACGSALSSSEVDDIVELSDTATITGADGLTRLEDAVDRHHRITEILSAHRDLRGLFAIGLDAVEYAAVMPLQRDPAAFLNREYAHAISTELLRRFLDNLHAEFTGGVTEPHWAHYFALAKDCGASRARTAMAGYNAHLTVDLAYSVAAVHSRPEHAPDYFKIVASIAAVGDVIIDRTKAVYGADLGPLWRFYFVGEGLDQLFGAGVATEQMLIAADLGANTVIFTNGLALQDPALAPGVRAEITALWQAADLAFEALARINAL